MRDPETDRLLTDVRKAVVAARREGVTVRACIWDATAAAVDEELHAYSPEARRTADSACLALEPPTAMANPVPRAKPPLLARLLWAAANWIAERKA